MRKILGIKVDCELKSKYYLDSAIRKTDSKVSALSFKLQFSYCSLIWMFQSRTINDKITFTRNK